MHPTIVVLSWCIVLCDQILFVLLDMFWCVPWLVYHASILAIQVPCWYFLSVVYHLSMLSWPLCPSHCCVVVQVSIYPFFLSECAFTCINCNLLPQWFYSTSSRSQTSLSRCAYHPENVFHLIFPNDVITPWQSVCHSIFPWYSCCLRKVHAASSPNRASM